MSYQPNNPNGQATMANSSPVVISSDQSTVPVITSGSGTLYDGTFTASTAAALPSHACSSVLVQNDPSNSTGSDIYVGNSSSQSIRLQPGQSEQLAVSNSSLVYVAAVSGSPRVNWHARS